MTTKIAIPTLEIGGVRFDNPLVLAPLSGITNLPFRLIAKSLGAGMVVSELVSSNGLIRAQARTVKYLDTHPDEWPISMQIFGDDPECMAEAARVAEQSGAHLIDINIGCPVKKVVKRGAGCALMRDMPRSAKLIGAVVKAVSVPVTVKIRAGWNQDEVNAPEYAAMAEAEGVKGITVHGRTREQMFSGQADWDIIRRTVDAVSVPVIGNGDVKNADDASRMIHTTGASGVMIGRAAQGYPWIFREILGAWAGQTIAPPTPQERQQVILRHMDLYVQSAGEATALREMRKHICWYVKGLPGSTRFRTQVQSIDTLDQVRGEIDRYFAGLAAQIALPA